MVPRRADMSEACRNPRTAALQSALAREGAMSEGAMAEQRVRIGLVGAGKNTRERHASGFRSLPDVEIVGVVNSTPESTARVARDLEISKTYPRWQDLVADPQVDAVCIGTWPNLHCEITCAALAAGKHVLTEARMARNLAEAKNMQAAAKARPELVA